LFALRADERFDLFVDQRGADFFKIQLRRAALFRGDPAGGLAAPPERFTEPLVQHVPPGDDLAVRARDHRAPPRDVCPQPRGRDQGVHVWGDVAGLRFFQDPRRGERIPADFPFGRTTIMTLESAPAPVPPAEAEALVDRVRRYKRTAVDFERPRRYMGERP
jgi:hypothetical protein